MHKMPPTLRQYQGGRHFHRDVMSEEQDRSRGDRREEVRRKRRYAPKLHGKRLAELIRNALLKRLRKKS